MPIGLLDEWVAEDTQTSRRKAEILERFVTSPEPMIGRLTQSEAAAVLPAAAQAAIAMATQAPGIWSSVMANLTGLTRDEVGRCVSVTLEFISAARHLADVVRRGLTKFPPGVHVLDEQVVCELGEIDSKLNETRLDIDRVAAALSVPRPALDQVKVTEALRQSREGGNLESADVIAAIKAARK